MVTIERGAVFGGLTQKKKKTKNKNLSRGEFLDFFLYKIRMHVRNHFGEIKTIGLGGRAFPGEMKLRRGWLFGGSIALYFLTKRC